MKISPLLWAGNQGYYGPATAVRFGGIVNYDEVQAAFKPRYFKETELNGIEYDEKQLSKPGSLHLLLSFERIDVIVAIHCSRLIIMEAEPETKEAA